MRSKALLYSTTKDRARNLSIRTCCDLKRTKERYEKYKEVCYIIEEIMNETSDSELKNNVKKTLDLFIEKVHTTADEICQLKNQKIILDTHLNKIWRKLK